MIVNYILLSKYVQEIITDFRIRLRNRAILRNLCVLTVIMPDTTRWSGMKQMFNRFVNLSDDRLKAADMDETKGSIYEHKSFPECY